MFEKTIEKPLPPQDREVIKKVESPRFMDFELVEKWGDGIPTFSEADPTHPEWRATPVIPIDLSREGYGQIFVKNEADPNSNRTGTIKDRAAWELATLYRDYARALYLKIRAGTLTKDELKKLVVPRLSLVTAGNEGRAVAEAFKQYDLPAPKLILDKGVSENILKRLKKLPADIYLVDLSRKELTSDEIKQLSDNADGIDITSVKSIEPQAIFYDWHVHEAFNETPDEIYVPYGSGRLMENYLTWQERSMRNESNRRRDPRLKANISKVISMNIFGAEPKEQQSIADKLTAPFKPFLLFKDEDVRALVDLSFTGRNTRKDMVNESRIKEAHQLLMKNGIEAEPSAATGLALYLERYERGLIQKDKKILVVNTGKGL